jgi:hypothetical protein
MTIHCEQCAYWDCEKRDSVVEQGYCRRGAPSPVVVPLGADAQPSMLAWPITSSLDWCGHAVPRDAGGAMAVVTEAQALVDEFEREHRVTSNSVWALRDALERMKP